MTHREYDDFVVSITSSGGEFRVDVRSEAGDLDDICRLDLPFEVDEIPAVVAAVAPRGYGGAPEAQATRDPVALGTELFRAVFREEVYDKYLKSLGMAGQKGLRIRIDLDLKDPPVRELARLPWELLHDGREFLNLSPNTPIVRYLRVGKAPEPAPFDPPLRVLVVAANPPGSEPLALEEERKIIEASFPDAQRGAIKRVEVTVIQEARQQQLFDELDKGAHHVLHYMGHGEFDTKTGLGCLLMMGEDGEMEEVTSETLSKILLDSTIRLAFLNACKTGAAPAQEQHDPFGGVAAALVQAGIPAVVAMQYPISDSAAVGFARTFYDRIANGLPVDFAVSRARTGLDTEDSTEWCTPVLFLRSKDGVLFESHEPELEPLPIPDEGFAVRLIQEQDHLVLEWATRRPGTRDFVALYRGQPDPDRPESYLWAQYEFVEEATGSWRSTTPAGSGYYVGYVSEDEEGVQKLEAIAGSS